MSHNIKVTSQFQHYSGSLSEKISKKPSAYIKDPFFPLLWYTTTVGNWHLIGFAQNCIERILYVDDIEVDSDSVENLESASLYICTDNSMEPGKYWSSLIDDVLIYNRVVIP